MFSLNTSRQWKHLGLEVNYKPSSLPSVQHVPLELHHWNYTPWLNNLIRQPTNRLQQKVFNHYIMSHPTNALVSRIHSSSVTPKPAVHEHYTETRHSSWSAAMCAASHVVQLMSHVSTAAAMTTRQTSCAPVQRSTVASLGSCQTHLVVEGAMKPRDAGCTTSTPSLRPQHAHTCVGRNAPQVSVCSTQSEQITPLDSPMERKAWPPPSHHDRVITLPGSSLCLLQATRRWGAPGRYSGGEASTLPASPPLLPRPGIARPFAFYLWPRL